MKFVQVCCGLVFLLVGPASLSRIMARKGVKDYEQERLLEERREDEPSEGGDKSRIRRSSLVYSLVAPPNKYQLAGAPIQSKEPLSLVELSQKQGKFLGALSALSTTKFPRSAYLQQPRIPVLHATPLEPYGALLTPTIHSLQPQSPGHEVNHKTATPILVTPRPIHDTEPAVASGRIYHPHQGLTEAIIGGVIHQETYNHHPNHHPNHQNHLEEPTHYAAKYQFGYQVRDQKSGNFFGHTESRDGDTTKGHYHVLLPDGRLQNVQYWADVTGFHAQVSYNGLGHHH